MWYERMYEKLYRKAACCVSPSLYLSLAVALFNLSFFSTCFDLCLCFISQTLFSIRCQSRFSRMDNNVGFLSRRARMQIIPHQRNFSCCKLRWWWSSFFDQDFSHRTLSYPSAATNCGHHLTYRNPENNVIVILLSAVTLISMKKNRKTDLTGNPGYCLSFGLILYTL